MTIYKYVLKPILTRSEAINIKVWEMEGVKDNIAGKARGGKKGTIILVQAG